MTDSLLTRRPAPTATADDAELARVLETYLADVEAGRAASPAELVAAHPHLAERLEGCLASLEFLEQAGGEVRHAALAGQVTDSLLHERAALGDFRLIREIGRGGMGVVYEAEQLSLGRRVAVKVLPFAAMLDERQLARFKNEARAAASLHHPHIVPVFYVGVERGVHYYAMQYIEGKSLAEVGPARQAGPPIDSTTAGPARQAGPTIDSATADPARQAGPTDTARGAAAGASRGARSDDRTDAAASADAALRVPHAAPAIAPDTLGDAHAAATLPDVSSPAHFRRVAELGIQAAEALHYAHESGVVHRDVKPSNLLVEPNGHLWVADFGLARIGADPTMTLTGDLLGTLRYMSPEQVRGKSALVDHRTDVYSLGVTLYELLTLRPALGGEDGEQLLRQVVDQEPAAPRSLDKAIPVDLETIVLKAIRKDAATRYATAQDLADDLQRFLSAKPIIARRPTALERLANWSVRHARLVLIVSAALLATTIIAVAAAVLIGRALREQAAATQRADERLRFARRVVDEMYTKVAQGWLADQPRMTPLQTEFLFKAAEFYRELAMTAPDDPQSQADAAMALWRLEQILAPQGRLDESEGLLRDALGRLERSLQAEPTSAEFEHRWATIAMALAWIVGEQDRPQEAVQLGAAAAERWQDLSRRFPHEQKYRAFLLDLSQNLGASLSYTRPREAEPHLRRAVAGYEQALAAHNPPQITPRNLASAQINLGRALIGQNRHAEADVELAAAIKTLSTYGPVAEASPEIRHLTAKASSARAEALLAAPQAANAAAAIDAALALYEPLAAEFPDRPLYQHELNETRKLREQLLSTTDAMSADRAQ